MFPKGAKWAVPAIVLAVIVGVIYLRSNPRSKSAGASTASKGDSKVPNLWLDPNGAGKPASNADQQHELAGLKDQLKQNPNHPPALLRAAEVARGLGKSAESIDYLTQAVTGDPENAEARLELGRELFESGNVNKGIEETKKILEKKPNYVDALYNLGAMYGNIGQNDSAKQYFEKAVASEPNSSSGKKAKAGLETLAASK